MALAPNGRNAPSRYRDHDTYRSVVARFLRGLVSCLYTFQTKTWHRDRASSLFPGRQSDDLGEDFFRLCPLSSRCRDAPHNLSLPVGRDRAVARESSQYAFVTKVLAPNLEFLRRKLELIGDLDQRVAETVRVGARKASRSKGVLKDLSNGRGIRPMPTREANGAEAAGLADADLCRGKERVVPAPELFVPKEVDPLGDDRPSVITDGEEVGREGLRPFSRHLARVLVHLAGDHVDMLQLERGGRAVASAGQQRECNHGTVAFLDVGFRWHGGKHVEDLFDGWYSLLSPCGRHSR